MKCGVGSVVNFQCEIVSKRQLALTCRMEEHCSICSKIFPCRSSLCILQGTPVQYLCLCPRSQSLESNTVTVTNFTIMDFS